MNAAVDLHAADPGYGYRFISDELAALGITASERRVWRLCSQQRLWSLFSKKCGLNRKAGPPVHDDLVERVFAATRLNQLWLTDITGHWTDEGKLYLCAIKDVRSNKIFGYSIDDRMKGSLAVKALRYAVKARPHAGTGGQQNRNFAWRWCSGSSEATTANDANAVWVD
jgi:putative transposase